MDSFSERLGKWLASHEDDRRAALCGITAFLFFTNFASWRTAIIVGGVCMMIEGWAMLMSKNESQS